MYTHLLTNQTLSSILPHTSVHPYSLPTMHYTPSDTEVLGKTFHFVSSYHQPGSKDICTGLIIRWIRFVRSLVGHNANHMIYSNILLANKHIHNILELDLLPYQGQGFIYNITRSKVTLWWNKNTNSKWVKKSSQIKCQTMLCDNKDHVCNNNINYKLCSSKVF